MAEEGRWTSLVQLRKAQTRSRPLAQSPTRRLRLLLRQRIRTLLVRLLHRGLKRSLQLHQRVCNRQVQLRLLKRSLHHLNRNLQQMMLLLSLCQRTPQHMLCSLHRLCRIVSLQYLDQ